MPTLREVLQAHVDDGGVPGAVGLIAHGDRVETAAVGLAHAGGTVPMTADSLFRWASITKPLTAAAVLMLVEDGVIGLHDPIAPWLPELTRPRVVRTPGSPLDEVVPAHRPITVFDLLTSRAGYGWASDFELPAVRALFPVQRDGREPQSYPPMDEWPAELAAPPLSTCRPPAEGPPNPRGLAVDHRGCGPKAIGRYRRVSPCGRLFIDSQPSSVTITMSSMRAPQAPGK
ncbi:serine hydrolase domain-containing protein [Nocardia sp. NPDC004711]